MEAKVHVGSIEHLDFEVEEEKKEEKRHYGHPTDPNKFWCGELPEKPLPPYTSKEGGTLPEKITCVGCLHQYIAKGSTWWWNVHNAWFQSSCGGGHHNCAA